MEYTVITGVLMFVKTSSALRMDDIIEKDTPKGIDGVGIAMDIVQTENGRCYLFTANLKQFGEYDYYVLDEWFRKVWAKHKIILKSFTLTAFSDGIYASWNYSSNPHHFDIIIKKKEEEFTDVF